MCRTSVGDYCPRGGLIDWLTVNGEYSSWDLCVQHERYDVCLVRGVSHVAMRAGCSCSDTQLAPKARAAWCSRCCNRLMV